LEIEVEGIADIERQDLMALFAYLICQHCQIAYGVANIIETGGSSYLASRCQRHTLEFYLLSATKAYEES